MNANQHCKKMDLYIPGVKANSLKLMKAWEKIRVGKEASSVMRGLFYRQIREFQEALGGPHGGRRGSVHF